MSESILTKNLQRVINTSTWKVDRIEYNRHYSTRKIIACSVYCQNDQRPRVDLWIYFHEKQIIDGTERGIQFSFTKSRSRTSQLFTVLAEKMTVQEYGKTDMEIILKNVLLEDMSRQSVRIRLSAADESVNLTEVKAYIENEC